MNVQFTINMTIQLTDEQVQTMPTLADLSAQAKEVLLNNPIYPTTGVSVTAEVVE